MKHWGEKVSLFEVVLIQLVFLLFFQPFPPENILVLNKQLPWVFICCSISAPTHTLVTYFRNAGQQAKLMFYIDSLHTARRVSSVYFCKFMV